MITEIEQAEALICDFCGDHYNDPLGWVLGAFDWGHGELEGRDGPDVWQRKRLIELGERLRAEPFNRVDPVPAIRMATTSGHGIGKSAFTCWIILFVMSTRPFCRGIVTANTGPQLKTKTWSELSKWRSLCITRDWFRLTTGNNMSLVHVAKPNEWRVDGQTWDKDNSEAFAGLHAANSTPFYIFDEASNIPDVIWEVAEGGLTDGQPMFFAFGNPTRKSGKFYNCFKRPDIWSTMKVDSREAKMTNKRQIEKWRQEHGDDSDFFRVRVKGEFPRVDETQFMPSDVVENARKKEPFSDESYPLVCGIDVARGGSDSTVLYFRRGKDAKTYPIIQYSGEMSNDHWRLASLISEKLKQYDPKVIFIDATGGYGGGLADHLRALSFNVIDIKFGSKAANEGEYSDNVAEMGARLKKWMIAGGAIKDNDNLQEELCDRMFMFDSQSRLRLEPKKDVKKRLGKSPDLADALYLTFAQDLPPEKPRNLTPRPQFYGTRVPDNKDSTRYNPLDSLRR